MKTIILSLSSDIGLALGRRWISKGHEVVGTFRTRAPELDALLAEGAKAVKVDFSKTESIDRGCEELLTMLPTWDVVVDAVGSQLPVGPFEETDIDEWSESVAVNFTNQLRAIHRLLSKRSAFNGHTPAVILFAGGGTNNAPVNYSGYTVSKIASIKMMELLDSEIQDCKFSIIGPGWVKTKIHEPTLRGNSEMAGENYERTKRMLASESCTPMEDVLDSIDWAVAQPRMVVGGRNFSTVYDKWRDQSLSETLMAFPDYCKLRRLGNAEVAAVKWDNGMEPDRVGGGTN